MENVHILNQVNSIANNFLAEIRSKERQTDRSRFRRNIERLGSLMAYEISKRLAFGPKSVATPLGTVSVQVTKEIPVLIGILRAGLPFFQGMLDVFDFADCGFVGAYRDEHSKDIKINLDYLATPDLGGRLVFLIDPMLATGRSFVKADAAIRKNGKPHHVHCISMIATPQGIRQIQDHIEGPVTIWSWAVDEELNALSYIVPGIGDAGDLSFGPKL